MSEALDRFRVLVDALRETRRALPGGGLDSRPLLDRIEDCVSEMTDEEQEIASNESWRGWPNLYDQHMKEQAALLEAPTSDLPGEGASK